MSIKIKLLTNGRGKVPTKSTQGAAGWDLYAAAEAVIMPGETRVIETGISITVPQGTYGRITPRSGLAVRSSIMVNAGVIDMDYTGEVKVVLVNLGKSSFAVNQGDRVAQLICEKINDCPLIIVEELATTGRGEKGFGSSGKK